MPMRSTPLTGRLSAMLPCLAGLLFTAHTLAGDSLRLNLAAKTDGTAQSFPLATAVHLPDECTWEVQPDKADAWLHAKGLQYSLIWPAQAPADAQTLLFLIDRDGFWYQALVTGTLKPGTNTFTVSLEPGAPVWEPVGHAAPWHDRALLNPRTVGIRLFGHTPFAGSCVLLSAALVTAGPPPPPTISRVRAAAEVPCHGLFEVAFELPDRYADPFDPAQIDVSATITDPHGQRTNITGFYYQDFYRLRDTVQTTPQPQGRPEWRLRFCPRLPGAYRYTIHARDRYGQADWPDGAFTATAGNGPLFVRVSARDPRYFELDDGSPFVPLGHNIRSPYDARMDDKFPWKLRHPEGTTAYERFFRDMETAHENLVEVWSCAWSLGLEWSDVISGYHGTGDYNLANAWELDRVLDLARQRHLRVNLVLNNHGRVCSWLDAEWHDHPYCTSRGGWLENPLDFFSDSTAIERQKQLYRYYLARWGWDATIFAWELFSEVNLCGSEGDQKAHYDSRVVAWHRQFGAYFHEQDPNRHLVTTHVSADYKAQNPDLCRVPELDACAVDAYHYGGPSQIISLLQETAQCNNAFGKPVLVTEFGGSPMAAGFEHLRRELHAALWTSVCTPLSGAPLFWWWQLVEERNLYPEYQAIARFTQATDPRNPAVQIVQPELRDAPGTEDAADRLQAVAMASATNAVGWIYVRSAFDQRLPAEGEDDRAKMPAGRVQLVLNNLKDGTYRVEFVDTTTGEPFKRVDVRSADNQMTVPLPDFARDIAFRIAPVPAAGRK